MKKVLTALVCCVAMGIAMNLQIQYQKLGFPFSTISMDNIEALAQSESVLPKCHSLGTVDCPQSSIKVMYVQ